MSVVQKVRYGRFNLLIAGEAARFTAKIELAVTREQIGAPVTANTFEDALIASKLEALRAEQHEAEDALT